MSQSITLTTNQFKQFDKHIVDFFVHHSEVFTRSYPGFRALPKNERIKLLLGYSRTGIYSFTTDQKITLRNLQQFRVWINEAEQMPENEDADLRLLDTKNFLDGLEGTILSSKSKRNKNNEDSDRREGSGMVTLLADKWYYLWEMCEEKLMRKVVEFGSLKRPGRLDVVINPIKSFWEKLEGETVVDYSENYIIINASEKDKTNYTNFMFRVKPGVTKLELLLGHMTSPHRDKGHLISKRVVLEIVDKKTKPQPAEFFISDMDDIPVAKNIIKLLFEKTANRLSSPIGTVILSPETLDQFQASQDEEFTRSTPTSITGNYKLYVDESPFGINSDIVEHPLKLSTTKFTNEIQAEYEERGRFYKGKVNYVFGCETLSILLDGPYRKFINGSNNIIEQKIENRPIYMVITVPIMAGEIAKKENRRQIENQKKQKGPSEPIVPIEDAYAGTITKILD